MREIFGALVIVSLAVPVTAKPRIDYHIQRGQASWYNTHGMVAAHNHYPVGSKLLVINTHTHKSVVVRVAGTGPFVRGRIIDLSPAAARKIGMQHAGVATVIVRPLQIRRINQWQ